MNTIIFGGENSNKTAAALNIIRAYSPSNLKYKRKIELEVNGENYYFNISDVHFEIDFDLLGTNETAIWGEFINHVFSIIESSRTSNSSKDHFILCKNIHTMKDELLQIFYTFIRNKNISFIFTTQHVSFLPTTLKNKCAIIHLKKGLDYSTQYISYCDEIIQFVKEKKDDLFLLRELLYNLLTYNCNMHTCFYYIYSSLVCSKNNIQFNELIDIIKKYNTNYRPIYHLESFVIYLLLNHES
jgi:hypothetical protein